MPAGIYHALYPSKTQNISVDDAIKSIKRIFKSDIAPTDVAAIILEPVQGEGGFNVCPPEFMRKVREICDEHGIVMIADEVQSGFARSGKLFAMEHFDVKPDCNDYGEKFGRVVLCLVALQVKLKFLMRLVVVV